MKQQTARKCIDYTRKQKCNENVALTNIMKANDLSTKSKTSNENKCQRLKKSEGNNQNGYGKISRYSTPSHSTLKLKHRTHKAVWCLTTDWTTGVRSPTEEEDFSSSLCVQTGSGAHPASCSISTGGKARPGRDTDHSPPSSAEFKNE
jgi:hypothetical protein